MQPDELSPDLLRSLLAEARRCWPAEACGLILGDGKAAARFVAIPNVAGTAAGSGTSARSVRDGYVMDPARLLAVLAEAESEGAQLLAIVHSHPEAGAYFSHEDREMALAGGKEPLWPGVDYLVVSVRQGVADDVRLYRWEAVRGDFAEIQIAGIAGVF